LTLLLVEILLLSLKILCANAHKKKVTMRYAIQFFIVMAITITSATYSSVDLVVFSFDRPLQLYAFLESVEKYITGYSSISVVYRSSDVAFSNAYVEVKKTFAGVAFIAQGAQPKVDFKPLTIQAIKEGSKEYILFGVDDIIVKDYIDLSNCVHLLKKTGAHGFYLSLGNNLSYCYPLNCNQKLPRQQKIQDDVSAWLFAQSECDWNYPHTVDMTVYKKSDILPDFINMNYYSPNSCESEWANRGYNVINKIGLFFEFSKVVNLPLNRVQNDFHNINMNLLSPLEMLHIFNDGLKIDIQDLYKVSNKSRHMEYVPKYIQR